MKLAKVDCGVWPNICQSVGVVIYPTVRFYGGSRGGHIQTTSGVTIKWHDGDSIVYQVEKELIKTDRLYKVEL